MKMVDNNSSSLCSFQQRRRQNREADANLMSLDLDLNKKSGKLTPAIEETEEENVVEEDSVKSSPEGTPKLKKKSVTEQPKINGKVAHSGHAHTRETSAKSINKVPLNTGLSNGKLPAKSVSHRKISDSVKPKKWYLLHVSHIPRYTFPKNFLMVLCKNYKNVHCICFWIDCMFTLISIIYHVV